MGRGEKVIKEKMKWTGENDSTLEVSYLSKRVWYLLLGILLALVILTAIDVLLRLYTFYWLDKNNVISNIMEILK